MEIHSLCPFIKRIYGEFIIYTSKMPYIEKTCNESYIKPCISVLVRVLTVNLGRGSNRTMFGVHGEHGRWMFLFCWVSDSGNSSNPSLGWEWGRGEALRDYVNSWWSKLRVRAGCKHCITYTWGNSNCKNFRRLLSVIGNTDEGCLIWIHKLGTTPDKVCHVFMQI